METKLTPEILQNTLYNLDVSTTEARDKIEKLVSHLEKSSISFAPKINPRKEQVQRKISNSGFLTNLTQNRNFDRKIEYEVIKREGSEINFHSDSVYSKLLAKPEISMGPFHTDLGLEVYFDFIRYEEVSSIRLNNSTEPLFYISAKIRRTLIGQTRISEIKLPKGDIWINAKYLTTGTPASTFMGLKIKSGRIRFGTPVTPIEGEIILNPLLILGLELELDNDFEVGTDEEFGVDAKEIDLNLPSNMEFTLRRGKLNLAPLDSLQSHIYGDSKEFQIETNFTYHVKDKLIYLPLQPDQPNFQIRDLKSKFWEWEGETYLKYAHWFFNTKVITSDYTTPIQINGFMSYELEEGLSGKWMGLEKEANFKLLSPVIKFIPGIIGMTDYKTQFSNVRETLQLWQKKSEISDEIYDMEAHLDFSAYQNLTYSSDAKGVEIVYSTTDIDLFIDKPLQADGKVISPQVAKAMYVKLASKNNSAIHVMGNLPEPTQIIQKHQFVLENAFLTTGPLETLYLRGKYDSKNTIVDGQLSLKFDLLRLIPSLPHPYTGRVRYHSKYRFDIYQNQYEGNLSVFGELIAECVWKDSTEIRKGEVDFKMTQNLFHPNSYDLSMDGFDDEDLLRMKGLNEEKNRRLHEMFTLLDVSTHEDHLGVSMSFGKLRSVIAGQTSGIRITEENVVTIERMNLRAPMTLLNGLTLPHVTWEPLINETVPDNPDDPKAGYLVQSNNQYPTVFSQEDHRYINIHPRDYIVRFQKNLKPKPGEIISTETAKEGSVFFTLPNGKISVAQLVRHKSSYNLMNKKHLDFIQPKFKFNSNPFEGGIQYRISAFSPVSSSAPPELKGFTVQLRNITNNPGKSLLSETVHEIFTNVFSMDPQNIIGVPLTHFDFSGYGASTYSDWLRPKAKYASIAQAKFDIMRGRLGHEIIQAVSMIYPYGVCATRTITFFRRNNSIIYRDDSGWVAQSDGLFCFDVVSETEGFTLPSQIEFHPGLFKGVYDVENIKEVSGDYIDIEYTLQNGDYYKPSPLVVEKWNGPNPPTIKARFIGVTFDSDALVENSEGFENYKVTGKKFKGYLQILPEGVPVPARVIDEILQRSGDSLGGAIDCQVDILNSGQRMKANRVDITRSYQGDIPSNPVFIGTVRGSVSLPKEGSWSVVEVDKQGNVGNLSDDRNISLIRKGLRSLNNPEMVIQNEAAEARIAFPNALLNNDIQKTYGIVQNTENQKVLFQDPFLKKNQLGKLFMNYKTKLADSFRLLDSKGPFPNLSKAIEIENDNSILDVLPNSQGIKKVLDYTVPDNFQFNILGSDTDPFRIYVEYKSQNSNSNKRTAISYVTDSLSGGDKWKNEMENLTIKVDLSIFEPLLIISGDFQSGISIKPSLEKGSVAQLRLNDELEAIYQILEFLDELSMDKPVEAIKKGLQIAMSNSSDSWEYKFKASKEISLVRFPFDPVNYNSPTTPLKMEAFFRVGCYFNQPIVIPKTINQIKPSAGAFMELGAELRVMCVSLAAATIYAVGKAELGLAADLNNPPGLYFKFGFGVELAVGLPVIGSVSVMFMVGIDIKISDSVLVAAFIYFRGRAEILGGIVTITISIEAKGAIEKPSNGPTNCIASCTFALDISIAFVINLSFTETWKESRQIS